MVAETEPIAASPDAAAVRRGAAISHTRCLRFQTGQAPAFHDITAEVLAVVAESGVAAGQVTIFSRHTTAAIVLNEHEPLLLQDMARLLRELAPHHTFYHHNDFSRRTVNMTADECRNGHAHCAGLLLRASETAPLLDGQLLLGPWQRIFLVELDHPRQREVIVSVLGTSSVADSGSAA